LLNRYNGGQLNFNGLNKEYHTIGTKGHSLAPYIPSLEAAHIHPNIFIHCGFIPRPYDELLMQERKDRALQAASKAGLVSKYETVEGTDQHYNFFESLLTDRNICDSNGNDAARSAQVQKDMRESAEKIQEETRQAHDRVGSSGYKEGEIC